MPDLSDFTYTELHTRTWQANEQGYDLSSSSSVIQTCRVSQRDSVSSPREAGVLRLRQNPCYLLKGKIVRGKAGLSYSNEPLERYKTLQVVGPLSLVRPDLSSVDDRTRAAAWGKVYSEVTELRANVALMLAERKESMEAIVDAMGRMAKFYKAMKARDFRHAAALAGVKLSRRRSRRGNANASSKEIASLYLQFTLGLQPTAQDVYNLVTGSLRPIDARIVTSQSEKGEQEVTVDGDLGSWLCNVGYYSRCSVTVRAYVPNDLNWSLHFLDQFGFTNPAALAWELLPLSFVANWFIDMGSFLSQFSAFTGMEIAEISETYTHKCAVLESSFVGPQAQAGYDQGNAMVIDQQRGYYVEKRRILLDKPPILPPQFGPGISDALVGKSITLAALLRQFIR